MSTSTASNSDQRPELSSVVDDPAWPYYSCIENEEWHCLFPDMLRAATNRIGATLTFKPLPESRQLLAVLQGDVDIGLVFTSPELPLDTYPSSLVVCPQALFTNPYVVFKRKSDPYVINNEAELHNYHIGIIRVAEPYRYRIDGQYPRKLTRYNEQDQLIKGLLARRVDLILMDIVAGVPILEELEALNKVTIIYRVANYKLYFAYSKNTIEEKPILTKLCHALDQLAKEGVLRAIFDERTKSIPASFLRPYE